MEMEDLKISLQEDVNYVMHLANVVLDMGIKIVHHATQALTHFYMKKSVEYVQTVLWVMFKHPNVFHATSCVDNVQVLLLTYVNRNKNNI